MRIIVYLHGYILGPISSQLNYSVYPSHQPTLNYGAYCGTDPRTHETAPGQSGCQRAHKTCTKTFELCLPAKHVPLPRVQRLVRRRSGGKALALADSSRTAKHGLHREISPASTGATHLLAGTRASHRSGVGESIASGVRAQTSATYRTL